MLIAFVVFVVVIVVVADRVGASVASHVLADKLKSDENLPSKPSTSIGGIPFLTQAASGKYNDVSVTATDFVTDGVHVSTMTVHLHGVHLPLGKVVGGSVHQVPVDRVDGSAQVSFAEMHRYLAGHGVSITFSRGANGTLQAKDKVQIGPKSVTASVSVALSITSNVITLTLNGLQQLGKAVGGSGVLAVPLQGLPFRVQLHSVSVGTDGVSATGSADHIVLGS